MSLPRTVKQSGKKERGTPARQNVEGAEPGRTPGPYASGTVPFMQRYLGNLGLQSSSSGSEPPPPSAVPSVVQAVVRSPGHLLDPATRTPMDARFAATFRHAGWNS